ncbi:MAG: 6-phosphogluconolactonase [Nitrospirae bacterium]|nr:6-phosphogluconolactonase [Nitrospirota bacterium]
MAPALDPLRFKRMVCRDKTDLAQKAAGLFSELASAAIRQKGSFSAVLSGGTTPQGLYRHLAGRSAQPPFEWEKVHLFFGDERMVPADHPDSNFRMVQEALFSKINLPPSHIHRIKTELENPEEAAIAYEKSLRTFFKIEGAGFPQFDLVILGVGNDGHTASLFPGSKALNEKKKWVAAPFVEKLKATRISLTFPVLNRAAHILVLATGKEKREILNAVFNGSGKAPGFPIQRIRPAEGFLTLMIDQEADSG